MGSPEQIALNSALILCGLGHFLYDTITRNRRRAAMTEEELYAARADEGRIFPVGLIIAAFGFYRFVSMGGLFG